MIRIAIAEQQSIVRWALREALATMPDLTIVGGSGTIADTLELIRREKPDVLLLDVTLPDGAGPDMLAELRELDESPWIVLLGAPGSNLAYAVRALAAGAHGYVPMSATPEELVHAIRAVSRGERVVPPDVEALGTAAAQHPASTLTHRELQVMELIARGMTNGEIAENLGISVKTVDTHRGHVIKKLGLRNNSELTRFAVKHGYVAL